MSGKTLPSHETPPGIGADENSTVIRSHIYSTRSLILILLHFSKVHVTQCCHQARIGNGRQSLLDVRVSH